METTNRPTPTTSPQSGMPTQENPTFNILTDGLDFPEGPAFDPSGNLWCTEMGNGNLILWSQGQVERFPTQGKPNSLAFDRQGRVWICDSAQNAIRRFDPSSQTWETMADQIDGKTLQTPNDLAFDALGNLVFTNPNYQDERKLGYIGCLSPDGKTKLIAENMYRPNGLDFVNQGKELVVADTYMKALYRGVWNAKTLEWIEPKSWVEVGGREGPDGMASSKDELIYCAVFGDGIIKVIDLQGKVIAQHHIPGMNPTNAAIDPGGRLGLVVTEAEKGLLISLPGINARPAIFDGGEAWS